jgi:hypothetical protein
MREKDKEDVTAHEYLITPPGQKKEWKKHKKKDTGVDSNLHWARLHTQKTKHTRISGKAKRNVSVAGTTIHLIRQLL